MFFFLFPPHLTPNRTVRSLKMGRSIFWSFITAGWTWQARSPSKLPMLNPQPIWKWKVRSACQPPFCIFFARLPFETQNWWLEAYSGFIHTLFFFSELPLIFITPLSDVKVFEKDEAKFECEVSREPKTYRWLKGTQEITGDDRIELIKDGTKHSRVIKSAAFEDEAKYRFEAEDQHTSGKLIIEGKHSYQIGYL